MSTTVHAQNAALALSHPDNATTRPFNRRLSKQELERFRQSRVALTRFAHFADNNNDWLLQQVLRPCALRRSPRAAAVAGGGGDGLTQDQRDDRLASTWPGMLTFVQGQTGARTAESDEPRAIGGTTPLETENAEPLPI